LHSQLDYCQSCIKAPECALTRGLTVYPLTHLRPVLMAAGHEQSQISVRSGLHSRQCFLCCCMLQSSHSCTCKAAVHKPAASRGSQDTPVDWPIDAAEGHLVDGEVGTSDAVEGYLLHHEVGV